MSEGSKPRSNSLWWGVVLEAPDAHVLADFYSRLLDWPIASTEPGSAIVGQPDNVAYLSFQSAPDYVPPVWPAEPGSQRMMMHLDVETDDLDAAVENAIDLGASLAAFQPQKTVRVMLDPAGHPFCLYLDPQLVASADSEVAGDS